MVGKLWDEFKDYHVEGSTGICLGIRNLMLVSGPRRMKRLYRVVDEIDKAMTHNVFVPNLSGIPVRSVTSRNSAASPSRTVSNE